jgi:hypothetical protein
VGHNGTRIWSRLRLTLACLPATVHGPPVPRPDRRGSLLRPEQCPFALPALLVLPADTEPRTGLARIQSQHSSGATSAQGPIRFRTAQEPARSTAALLDQNRPCCIFLRQRIFHPHETQRTPGRLQRHAACFPIFSAPSMRTRPGVGGHMFRPRFFPTTRFHRATASSLLGITIGQKPNCHDGNLKNMGHVATARRRVAEPDVAPRCGRCVPAGTSRLTESACVAAQYMVEHAFTISSLGNRHKDDGKMVCRGCRWRSGLGQ